MNNFLKRIYKNLGYNKYVLPTEIYNKFKFWIDKYLALFLHLS